MASAAGSLCAACNGEMGLLQVAVTSECAHKFHPHCVFGAAVCPVCGATRRDATPAPVPTSPFGFCSTKPEPADRTGLFGQQPPAMTASPFSFGFSPMQEEPPRTSLSGQQPPATASFFSSFSGFSHRGLEPADTSLFGQLPATASPFFHVQPHSPFGPVRTDTENRVFDDDEPVEEPPAHGTVSPDGQDTVQEAASNGALVLDMHCERPAVARGTPRDNFVVLVHAKAPSAAAAAPRASLDLVTVLDVSASMQGAKLALLKAAMGFVIDKLGPADRLSIVSFSSNARRVIRLTRMSDAGKASAKLAVQSLAAGCNTNILKGLDEAAKVLDGRRYRNAVASVILLSDGQDTCNWSSFGAKISYHDLVPRSLVGSDGNRSTPIHSFGFGTDHDAPAMHIIAEATGGTFSSIENQAVVQDSFAQCIGGLLSVAVQEAWITVTCPHPGVRVRAVKSGRYESSVVAYGRAASVDVGELYADEERRFLLFVDVPRAGAADDDVTRIVKVSCTYRDTATGQSMDVAGEDAVVRRPVEVTGQEALSMEVALERFRVEATEDIAAARAAAECGDHAEAARILDRRQEALQRSAPVLAGDARCVALVSELRELSARVANRREYEHTGRACLLAGMSSHAQQRASSVNLFSTMAAMPAFGCGAAQSGSAAPGPFPTGRSAPFGAAGAYATPAMKAMVDLSRKTREEQQQQQPASDDDDAEEWKHLCSEQWQQLARMRLGGNI